MRSSILVDLLLSIGVMLTPMSHQQPSDSVASAKEPACPIIDVTGVETDGKTLRLHYEIINESKHCIWILVGFRERDASAELFMHDDGQTIVIRRRFDVLFDGGGETVFLCLCILCVNSPTDGVSRVLSWQQRYPLRSVSTLATCPG